MNELKIETKRKKTGGEGPSDPVHVVRQGAVAASIWLRQSPSGYAYYDFSLSRSWKSVSSGKTGYSHNFFARNGDELRRVVEGAAEWIEQHQETLPNSNGQEPFAA